MTWPFLFSRKPRYTIDMMTLDTPLLNLPRVQKSYAPKLAKLGLETVGDLLRHFPVRYSDLSIITPIHDLIEDSAQTVLVNVEDVKARRIPGRKMHLTTASFSDASGFVRATWFNQPYIAKSLHLGAQVRLSGMVKSDKKGLFFSSPDVERAERIPTSTGCIVPVYRETRGLTSKWIRWQIQMILDALNDIPDILPQEIIAQQDFPELDNAFHMIHFPENAEDVIASQRRFAFEDLFLLQIIALRARALLSKERAFAIPFQEKRITSFVQSLPYTLTDAQRKSSFQIIKDLEKATPMNRLLNGDVGAGKTIVAAIAALNVATTGKQVAILAPTEVLARQHYNTLLELFRESEIDIALLTGAYKMHGNCPELSTTTTRPKLLARIKDGDEKIIIGTHALIQDDVIYNQLALVVVDEQQRFGVAQRSALIDTARKGHRGVVPHFLTMTATPIPRTFALALFGDLSVSLLDEKPSDRKPIKTAVVPEHTSAKIYSFIADELSSGRQGYVILSLVEESKSLAGVKAATEEYTRLQKDIFPQYTLDLLHGRMKPKEKEAVMQRFQKGQTDLLVSTSVVEVGVDVPNASVMIIENAERFGLAQLHQFRGRIGRAQHQSYCFLFTKDKKNKRLQALEKYTDGFKLAEKDLEIRGPGEYIGTRQSGIPDGAMKNIANITLVTATREAARATLIADPQLTTTPALKSAVARFTQKVHME